jgi:serine/threonine protein kinase
MARSRTAFAFALLHAAAGVAPWPRALNALLHSISSDVRHLADFEAESNTGGQLQARPSEGGGSGNQDDEADQQAEGIQVTLLDRNDADVVVTYNPDGDVITHSAFGNVYLDAYISEGRIALKQAKANSAGTIGPANADLEKEWEVLKGIDDPHVLHAHAFLPGDEAEELGAFLASEFLAGGDLDGRTFGEKTAKEIIQSAGTGLLAMHDANWAHRDIKPLNIMLRDADKTDAVLIDVGEAAKPTGVDKSGNHVMRWAASTDRDEIATFLMKGTRGFIDEVEVMDASLAMYGEHNQNRVEGDIVFDAMGADFTAIGLTLLCMLTGTPGAQVNDKITKAFCTDNDDETKTWQLGVNPKYTPGPDDIANGLWEWLRDAQAEVHQAEVGDACRSFIQIMLTGDIAARRSAIKSHAWFSE